MPVAITSITTDEYASLLIHMQMMSRRVNSENLQNGSG